MQNVRPIIARVIAGETNAFRILVDQYQGVVWTFCRNLVRHTVDADDMTQDVFLTAYRKLAQYNPDRAAFSTWLLTIARNLSRDRWKARSPEFDASLDQVDDSSPPIDSLTDAELWSRLDRALSQLPWEQRTAFVLAEIQELPHAEIAIIEEIEIGTVKSRVSRAKAKLRTVLGDWQPEAKTSRRETTP